MVSITVGKRRQVEGTGLFWMLGLVLGTASMCLPITINIKKKKRQCEAKGAAHPLMPLHDELVAKSGGQPSFPPVPSPAPTGSKLRSTNVVRHAGTPASNW